MVQHVVILSYFLSSWFNLHKQYWLSLKRLYSGRVDIDGGACVGTVTGYNVMKYNSELT